MISQMSKHGGFEGKLEISPLVNSQVLVWTACDKFTKFYKTKFFTFIKLKEKWNVKQCLIEILDKFLFFLIYCGIIKT